MRGSGLMRSNHILTIMIIININLCHIQIMHELRKTSSQQVRLKLEFIEIYS